MDRHYIRSKKYTLLGYVQTSAHVQFVVPQRWLRHCKPNTVHMHSFTVLQICCAPARVDWMCWLSCKKWACRNSSGLLMEKNMVVPHQNASSFQQQLLRNVTVSSAIGYTCAVTHSTTGHGLVLQLPKRLCSSSFSPISPRILSVRKNSTTPGRWSWGNRWPLRFAAQHLLYELDKIPSAE